jgi:hypothetical protein
MSVSAPRAAGAARLLRPLGGLGRRLAGLAFLGLFGTVCALKPPVTMTEDATLLAALGAGPCADVLDDAKKARSTIGLAPAALLAGAQVVPGECYYVLSQDPLLGSAASFALLGERVNDNRERRNLPALELLDRLRPLPGAFFYARLVGHGVVENLGVGASS